MRVILALSLLFAACVPPQSTPGDVPKSGATVVTVDGETVTQNMIDAVMSRMPESQLAEIKADEAQYRQFVERILIGQTLYKRAIAEGLDKKEGLNILLAMSARDVLAAEFLDTVSKAAIAPEKIKEAYEKKAVQFAKPSVQLKHIIVQDASKAAELMTQLQAGADFAEVAKSNSMDGGEKGGDLGWIEQGRMVPELLDPAFAASKGDLVGPITTRFGNHILKVLDKREATPLEEVRDQLAEQLEREAIESYIGKIKTEMKVEWANGAGPSARPEATPAGAPAAPAEAAPAAPAAAPTAPADEGH